MKIVLATGNPGKVREIRALLGQQFDVVSQSELGVVEAPEDGETFRDNALIKARNAFEQTGLAALADDSGLEVDSLDGRPGVYSARYAGSNASDSDNVCKLLHELESFSEADRTARFHCAMVFYNGPENATLTFAGTWEGHIANSPSGSGGFGYDPVFVPDGFGCTAAELSPDIKNSRSHRANALQQLVRALL